MSKHRLHKQRRAQRVELMIQRELAKAERILDENVQGIAALTTALDNEPRGIREAFAAIQQKGAGK